MHVARLPGALVRLSVVRAPPLALVRARLATVHVRLATARARSALARATLALALSASLLGCAAHAPAPSRSSCEAFAGASPTERICREDRAIETLQARFRADVEIGDERRSSEGVLLVRRPGALRVKLFGLGGMTVHDALWVADGDLVRGAVRRPFDGGTIVLALRPGERPAEPEAGLSFALWALWQERCAGGAPRASETGGASGGWLELEPTSAHAAARQVRVGPLGVEAERIVWLEDAAEAEVIRVRYRERDCGLALPLPTEIEMVASPQGWRARVRILEQAIGVDLDPALFALPAADPEEPATRPATPRSAAPGAATPRSAAPGAATPRSAAPGAATPRSAAPRSAAPAPPRSAAPKSAAPAPSAGPS